MSARHRTSSDAASHRSATPTRSGIAPDEKKAVRKRRNESEKAHDRKIDTLIAKADTGSGETAQSGPADEGYLRQVYRRPDNGAEIQVLDTFADGLLEPDGELRFAAYCVTHDGGPRYYATLSRAAKAAHASDRWCTGCAPVAGLKPKVAARAKTLRTPGDIG